MKFLVDFLKKEYPNANIVKAITTDSVYFYLEHNISVRVSNHYGHNDDTITIIKAHNTNQYVVTMCKNPYPIIKDRREIKNYVKTAIEVITLQNMVEQHTTNVLEYNISTICDWALYWGKVCSFCRKCSTFTKSQKEIIKKYFENEEICKLKLYNAVKGMTKDTESDVIEKELKKCKKDKE